MAYIKVFKGIIGTISALVPTMTSDNTPSGEVIGSEPRTSAFHRYRCFAGGYCEFKSPANLGYDFGHPVSVKYATYSNNNSSYNHTVYIESSSDGLSWNKVSNDVVVAANAQNINITVNVTTLKRYWRFNITSTGSEMTVGVCQFYGF